MNMWEFIIAVILIGAVARVLQTRYEAMKVVPRDDADREDSLSRDEVRRLKERIQVLERVITDNHGSDDLDRQIERLRDK